MLINKNIALTRHAKFFREGDALTVAGTGPGGSGTVATPANAGTLVLPDPSDVGWIDLDTIEDFEDKITDEKKTPIWVGIPGTLVKEDEITTMQGMETIVTTAKLTALAMEAFYRPAANIGQNDYQFAPLGQSPRRGWFSFVDYDHKNVQTIVGNIFCVLKVTGGMKGGKGELSLPQFSVTWLYSPLNTMAQGTDV